MMYREPGDIWIFQVATLNRITNLSVCTVRPMCSESCACFISQGRLALFLEVGPLALKGDP